MTTSKKPTAEKFLPYIRQMLEGKTLLPDDNHDRQALARIADGCRSVCFVPVETVRKVINGKKVIGYRISPPDVEEYLTNRPAQEARQRKVIEHAANQRDARRAKALFDRLGLALPPEVAALARVEDEPEAVFEVSEDGVIQKAS